MTLALFLLRAVQMNLRLEDLDFLEYGTVVDMMTESANDTCEYNQLATQEDLAKL